MRHLVSAKISPRASRGRRSPHRHTRRERGSGHDVLSRKGEGRRAKGEALRSNHGSSRLKRPARRGNKRVGRAGARPEGWTMDPHRAATLALLAVLLLVAPLAEGLPARETPNMLGSPD